MSEDVEWENPGPSDIPWAGNRVGRGAVQEFFEAIGGAADFETFEPRSFIGDGDNVIVMGFERARSKQTGRTYESHWCHAWTVSDGKIKQHREYIDTAAIAGAFQK